MNKLEAKDLEMLDDAALGQTAENEVSERWKPTDLASATWVFSKMKALQARMDEVKKVAEEEIFRIQSWEKEETAKDKQQYEYFEFLLREYYRDLKAADPKAKLTTPYGKVTSRKLQPKWEFEEEKTLQYMKENHPELVQVKESFSKTEAKKIFSLTDDFQAVDENGEIVEFVIVQPQGESITVKVEG